MKTSSRISYQSKNTGFSLIELMITLVIAGILVGIAVPSYSRYVERSKRAAAYACMTQVSAVMEQIYADSFKFSVDLDGDNKIEPGSTGDCECECASDGSECESLDEILAIGVSKKTNSVEECADQISSNYTLRFGSLNAKTFSLVAEPVKADFDVECGELTLRHNGKASAEGSLGDDCFSE